MNDNEYVAEDQDGIRIQGREPAEEGCPNRVDTGEWSNFLAQETGDGTITAKCGTYRRGVVQLCEQHRAEAEARYPQGWRGYPGDTCKHGVYVGGVMEDFMCAACEAGED